jgi:predicted small lipoprotein YifL
MCRNPLLFALVLAASLAACDQRPPRAAPEAGHADNDQPLPTPMRDRTLKQGGL